MPASMTSELHLYRISLLHLSFSRSRSLALDFSFTLHSFDLVVVGGHPEKRLPFKAFYVIVEFLG